MNRAQIAFALFGLLGVCSLLAASVGTVALELILDNEGDGGEFAIDAGDELVDGLRQDIERNPTDVASMALLAELLSYDGRLDEAIGWYEQALAIEPDNTRVRLSFARVLKDGGKRADAELQFRIVIEAEPGNVEAHYYLADLFRGWDPPRTDEAAAHYLRVIEMAPTAYLAGLSREQLTVLGFEVPAASPPATPAATPSG